ncbi:MAG: hypothetical protein EXX96DRAFT_567685 [Benjaminiella poitrasii]|nr:MAG: hypothetical protein EXX96DRAFT_567685 [Benjaminiella poitrasii]
MDRATEAAAHDLAEIRRLVEGMSALVNSEHQLELEKQQKLLQQQQKHLLEQQQQEEAERQSLLKQKQKEKMEQRIQQQNIRIEPKLAQPVDSFKPIKESPDKKSDTQSLPSPQQTNITNDSPNPSSQQQQNTTNQPLMQLPIANGIIIEVTHLGFTRTLYFQLSPEATIEPLIAWLRLSFGDHSISGMVLQYKGVDGLWKCLLNRDDSLKRVLSQSLKNNTILQMRVPREQDLLSSGYTDKRLLALTDKSTNITENPQPIQTTSTGENQE